LIDSDVFDSIVDEPGMLHRVRDLVEAERLELIAASVSRRQIARAPTPRRALLESVPVTWVGTAGFALDYSRLDVDRLGPSQPIDAIRKGRSKELEDALIAATALFDGVPLISEDKRLRNAVARELPRLRVHAWDFLRGEIFRLSGPPR
jgi:predicted nucleic acid-binding protein